jgi:hypothetical protein
MSTTDVWGYRNSALTNFDLTGFKVEAVDGGIGKIDETSNEVGGSYVVVDTGPWILERRCFFPPGSSVTSTSMPNRARESTGYRDDPR